MYLSFAKFRPMYVDQCDDAYFEVPFTIINYTFII